ncbi:MAG: helix-turn-helix transcriptional regulator [Lachnospiraceae bacterium]|nr:helix-turn-helix transcriptional regulator [Lachnospiraceae bacterium]
MENVTLILKREHITKNKMLQDLGLSRNSFVDWSKRGTIPSAKVVSAIADYLGTTISELMGYSENEEDLIDFAHKLSYQLAVHTMSVSVLSKLLDVHEDEIMAWIVGNSYTYTKYYKQLSEAFCVNLRYWTSPCMISPGIEPNTNEYMLILMYREYQSTGKLNVDAYGGIENFFPGVFEKTTPVSKADQDLLSLFHQLPYDVQLEFRGELKGYSKCLEKETVAAENLKQAK